MITENTDIRNTDSINEIVDCIENNVYGEAPLQLISFYKSLPNDQFNNYLRILAVPYLFHAFENNIKSDENPREWFNGTLLKLKSLIEDLLISNSFINLMNGCMEDQINENFEDEVKIHTGQH
ncbi:MAG: hypothetical protein WAV86_00810, partial [Lutibacter sp.]